MYEVLAALALAFLFVNAGQAWQEAPARYPTHFNAAGEPDKWGTRDSLWLLPVIGAWEYLLLTVLSRANIRYNLPSGVAADDPGARAEARELITAVKAGTLLIVAYIHSRTVAAAGGSAAGLGIWFVPVSVVLLLGLVAIYAVRLRRYRPISGVRS